MHKCIFSKDLNKNKEAIDEQGLSGEGRERIPQLGSSVEEEVH